MPDFERVKIPSERIPEVFREKWSLGVLDEGFVPIPKRFLRCMREILTGEDPIGELLVLLSIADYRRPKAIRPPSLERLAFTVGMSEDEFWKHLTELRNRELISTSEDVDRLEINIDPILEQIERRTPDEPGQLPETTRP